MNRLPKFSVVRRLPGSFLRVLAQAPRLTAGWRRRPTPSRPDAIDSYVAWLLRLEGCPACNAVADFERRHFFWFLHETYQHVFALEPLVGSFGFCPAHGAYLAGLADHSALAYIHLFLIGRVMPHCLGQERPAWRRALMDCPVCLDRDDQMSRTGYFLWRLLATGEGRCGYGNPGLLCTRHLRDLAPQLQGDELKSLLATHGCAQEAAREALLAENVATRVDAALRLSVGSDPRLSQPPVAGLLDDPTRDAPDAIRRLVVNLSRTDECSICREMRRARHEWLAWLAVAVERGQNVSDLLPRCPAHVWEIVSTGSSAVAVAVAIEALAGHSDLLEQARRLLDKKPRTQFRGFGRIRQIRASVGLPLERACSLCRRLEVAEEQSLKLLLALLEQERYRAAAEPGYGLCARHFVHALSLPATTEVHAHLLATMHAKLALLGWELEECQRKAAWQWRPETAGNEQTAARRAVLRFSGSSAFPATDGSMPT
jgi:hypothetical protein